MSYNRTRKVVAIRGDRVVLSCGHDAPATIAAEQQCPACKPDLVGLRDLIPVVDASPDASAVLWAREGTL